jgi:hypothetical protein
VRWGDYLSLTLDLTTLGSIRKATRPKSTRSTRSRSSMCKARSRGIRDAALATAGLFPALLASY